MAISVKNLVKDKAYWVATVFKYEYSKTTGKPYIAKIAYQKAWIMKAICIESEEIPSWSPNANNTHALMYFLKLEEDGMPFEENKFSVPCCMIFENLVFAQTFSDLILREYFLEKEKIKREQNYKLFESIIEMMFTVGKPLDHTNMIDSFENFYKLCKKLNNFLEKKNKFLEKNN